MQDRTVSHLLTRRFLLPVASFLALFLSSCDQKPLSLSPESNAGYWRPLVTRDADLGTNFYSLWGFNDGTILTASLDGMVSRYDGSTWDEGFAVFPSPVYDIWGGAPDDIYVVTESALNHFDGARWSEVGPGGHGLWGFASGDLFVVGRDAIRLFDGVSWTEIFRRPGTIFHDAWGSSPDDAYFVSDGGIYHFDGDSTVSLPGAEGYVGYGVWGSSAADIFFVGSGRQILQFDGSELTEMNEVPPFDYYCVWGSGPSDVYAAGYDGMSHFDGNSWDRVAVGYDPGFYSLWGNGPTEVYAGASYGRVFRYDGVDWRSIRGLPRSAVLAWASPSSDGLVVADEVGRFYIFDGGEWEALTLKGLTGGVKVIWGEDVDDFYVSSAQVITHFDGTSWTATDTLDVSVRSVWKYDRDLVYLAGIKIQKFDGSTWSVDYSEYPPFLSSIHGSSPSNIFAAGQDRDGGLVLRYDGHEWRVLLSGIADRFRAVWAISQTEAYFCGDFQGIVKYDGEHWAVEPTLDGERGYVAFWGSSSNELYAAGDRAIEIYNGALWSPSVRHRYHTFNHMTGRPGGRVYATNSSRELWYTEAR